MPSAVKREPTHAETAATAIDEDRLRFAPQILARLGEELNPHPDQGVLELVRNAYDADATRCVVELHEIAEPGGHIVIRDWGAGISREQISNGWLVIGRSSKTVSRRTEAGRLQIGQKGLGRLAALRLGAVAEMRTWPRARKGVKRSTTEHRVTLDWDHFDHAETVDEVAIDIVTESVAAVACGTRIEVRDLRRRWVRAEVKRLARALLLLGDPFSNAENGFTLELVCPEHPDLENLVAGSYFDYSIYQITARLDGKGHASLRLVDKRLGLDEKAEHAEIVAMDQARAGKAYATVPCEFDLSGFLRGGEALHSMGTAATLAGYREWLDAYGGVHVYHRGLRVAPYGDPGSDWLDMNLLRARNPEQRPSTNTAVGRMIVEDSRGLLVQKTDRSGFIEDERFEELRNFGRDVLEWVGRRRTKVADEQRENAKRQGPQKRANARQKLEREVGKLEPKQQQAVRAAVQRFERAAEEDAEQLREDLLLYRTLATIGTTSAQIAHETYNPALAIVDLADEIEEMGREELAGEDWKQLEPAVAQVAQLAKRLRDYAYLPRVLLAEPKRRMRTFAADRAVTDTVAALSPLLTRHGVDVIEEHRSGEVMLRGPSALLDAILANLVINAVHALDRQSKGKRRLLVRTSAEQDTFVLEVGDSGRGIDELEVTEIWVPGATSTPDGTGLGLTIVRDSASQLGGAASVLANGELGGAHFTIRLPVAT